MRSLAWWMAGIVACVWALGCGEQCMNGETAACVCTDGRSGAQLCRSNGVFDPCRCTGPATPDAGGQADAGATGGGSGGGQTGGGGGSTGGGGGGSAPRLTSPRAPHVVVDDPVTFSLQYDTRGLAPTWRWAITAPDGGVVPVDLTTPDRPTFIAPAAGTYAVDVSLQTSAGEASLSFPFSASTVRHLPFIPTAWAGHRGTRRIALAEAAPARIQLIDPSSGVTTTVPLRALPVSLAFTPDGTHLVVGEDGGYELIDLTRATPVVTAAGPLPLSPTVLAVTDTRAYLASSSTQLFAMELDGGQLASRSVSTPISSLAVHPDGTRLYGTTRSTGDLYRFELVSSDGGIGTMTVFRPVSSAVVCGEAWLTTDGTSYVTACGGVLRTSPLGSQDLVLGGSLPQGRYAAVTDSLDGGSLLGVTANAYGSGDVTLAPAQLRVIRRSNLLQTRTVSLPDTLVITNGQLEPKFVFLESPQRAHILMVAGRNVPTSRSIFVTVEVP